MKCKCGSTQFYVKSVDVTDDIESENMSVGNLLEQAEAGAYVDYNPSKGWTAIKCSGCEEVLATNK